MGSGASSKKQISCPVCKLSNLSSDEFVKHYRKSHNKQCTKCGLTGFETDKDMYTHYDQMHSNNNGITTITCRKCPEKFMDETEFIKHTNKEHGVLFDLSQISLVGRNTFTCPQCGKVKRNQDKLQKHLAKNHFHACVKCEQKNFKSLNELKDHHDKEHPPLSIKCPIKCESVFLIVDDFLNHLLVQHNFAFVASKQSTNNNNTYDNEALTVSDKLTCPKCHKTITCSEIVDHVTNEHSKQTESTVEGPNISCPKCKQNDDKKMIFKTSEDLIEHMRSEHNFSSSKNLQKVKKSKPKRASKGGSSQLPKVGDKVLAMWEVSMWQYFHATIRRKMEGELKYEIDWDDGDTTGINVGFFPIIFHNHYYGIL